LEAASRHGLSVQTSRLDRARIHLRAPERRSPEGCRPTTTLRSQPRFSVSDDSVRDLQLLELPDPTYQASSSTIELRAHNPSERVRRGPCALVSFRPLHGKQRHVPFCVAYSHAAGWALGAQATESYSFGSANCLVPLGGSKRLLRSPVRPLIRWDDRTVRPWTMFAPQPLGIAETSHGPCLATPRWAYG